MDHSIIDNPKGGVSMETPNGEKQAYLADQVVEVAKQQKRLIWLIIFEIFLVIAWIIFGGSLGQQAAPGTGGGSIVEFLISLILSIIGIYLVYKIARALEISTVWLVITIVLLLVPYISIIPLLYINGRATKFLRASGVSVGLMGANLKSVEYLRSPE